MGRSHGRNIPRFYLACVSHRSTGFQPVNLGKLPMRRMASPAAAVHLPDFSLDISAVLAYL